MTPIAHRHDVDLARAMRAIKRGARSAISPRSLDESKQADTPVHGHAPAAAPTQNARPYLVADPEIFYFMANRRFRMRDFLGVEQHKFVAAAYAALLRREPDAGGLAHYNSPTLASRFRRVEVIVSIRGSDEGRARNVQVLGLFFWRFVLWLLRPVEYRKILIRVLG